MKTPAGRVPRRDLAPGYSVAAIINERRDTINGQQLEFDRKQTEVAADSGRLDALRADNAEEKKRLEAERIHLDEVRKRLTAEDRSLEDERARIAEMWALVGRHREQAREVISALAPETLTDAPDIGAVDG